LCQSNVVMDKRIVTVDVREDIKNGREPFLRIMQAVSVLPADQKLLLITPFEPVPLYNVLGQRGFSHESRMVDEDVWEVLLERTPEATAPKPPPPINRKSGKVTGFVELDARGLEPPQPLVTILEALTGLPTGKGLRARTDRRPMHLYEKLEERGFAAESEEQSDGSFITFIRHV